MSNSNFLKLGIAIHLVISPKKRETPYVIQNPLLTKENSKSVWETTKTTIFQVYNLKDCSVYNSSNYWNLLECYSIIKPKCNPTKKWWNTRNLNTSFNQIPFSVVMFKLMVYLRRSSLLIICIYQRINIILQISFAKRFKIMGDKK